MSLEKRKQALAQALQDPEELVRATASKALDRVEGLAMIGEIAEAARNGAEPHRIRAIHFLGYLNTPESTDILLSLLHDPHFDIRVATIKALQNTLPEKALKPLAACLNDPEPSVLHGALETLSHYRDRKVTEYILPHLLNGDPETACSAAEALGRNGDPRAESYLAKALDSSSDPFLRAKAAEALGNLRPSSSHGETRRDGTDDTSER
ncbi:MAG: HEAT repeat domain-containing protein [Deltaproteobacteria bacterium]|nr:HEAT repeat domain-containing protein [Deltaproteobacteria bacterium]